STENIRRIMRNLVTCNINKLCMATIKFLIETIEHDFARTEEMYDYFILQHNLLKKGHKLQYHFQSSDEIATTISDTEHFYKFIRSFKFLPVSSILTKLGV